MQLACIMRVKDEAGKIVRCLDAMPFVEHFVVVDNGSEDNTVQLIERYPSTVLHSEGLDASRDLNMAYAAAKELGPDWVLWMDADEVWERTAAEHFPDLLGPGPINGWVFRVYPFVLSEEFYRIDRAWAQFTMSGQLRLFRAQDGIYWDDPRPTHPGLPQGLKGAIGRSDLRIKHYTIESQAELEAKIAFYEAIDGRDMSHLRNDEDAVFKRWWNGRAENG